LPPAVAPAADAKPPAAKPPAAPTSAETGSNRESAKAFVEKARAALRSGSLKDAESWFHRALESDRSNADALVGLAELYFEQGAYQRALEFARRGVKAAPKSGRHQLILGDVCFKVLRYADARTAYAAAQNLGHPSAKARLERIDETLGAQ
jgi:tetratricopeptide (TPR) repeat protein